MPSFPKPKFAYSYDVADEVAVLRQHKAVREVPARKAGHLLVATWNIANFGAQDRRDQDHRIIAEIISWFDLVAVQEIRENYAGIDDLIHILGEEWAYVMSDVAGNDERMVYLYRMSKLRLLEEIGEIAFPPSKVKNVKLPDVNQEFVAFDRNPYLATFRLGQTSFLFVNVHLYYGGTDAASMERRALETYAVAYWADARQKSKFSFTRNVVAMGDFNMPAAKPGDPIYTALTKKGLTLPGHSSQIGSSIASDNQYDQVAFFKAETESLFTGKIGVFDYDDKLFADLWKTRGEKDFKAYCRYYVSDHRPMWIEFKYSLT